MRWGHCLPGCSGGCWSRLGVSMAYHHRRGAAGHRHRPEKTYGATAGSGRLFLMGSAMATVSGGRSDAFREGREWSSSETNGQVLLDCMWEGEESAAKIQKDGWMARGFPGNVEEGECANGSGLKKICGANGLCEVRYSTNFAFCPSKPSFGLFGSLPLQSHDRNAPTSLHSVPSSGRIRRPTAASEIELTWQPLLLTNIRLPSGHYQCLTFLPETPSELFTALLWLLSLLRSRRSSGMAGIHSDRESFRDQLFFLLASCPTCQRLHVRTSRASNIRVSEDSARVGVCTESSAPTGTFQDLGTSLPKGSDSKTLGRTNGGHDTDSTGHARELRCDDGF